MKTAWWTASAVLALAVGLIGAPASWAKPADLPAQDGIECDVGSNEPGNRQLQIELGISPGGITLKWSASARPEKAPSLDTVMPAFIEQWLLHVGDMLARPERFAQLDAFWSKLPTLHTANFGGDSNRRRAAGEQSARAITETRLFEPINLRLKNEPLDQAIKKLGQASGTRMTPDYADLDLGGVNLKQPVSLTAENISAHAALQLLFKQVHLTYEIVNDVVLITRKQVGRNGAADRLMVKKGELAQQLFDMAEKHRRSRDYVQARKLYQQVHLLTPTTPHGRMAIVRIIEIEERLRDVSEEQGGELPGRNADPEQVFRDMHERSIPLGLVNVSY